MALSETKKLALLQLGETALSEILLPGLTELKATATSFNALDLQKLNDQGYDALLLLGSDSNPDVEKLVQTFYKAGKPIGAFGLGGLILAKVLGKNHITLTVGNNRDYIAIAQKLGAEHEDCAPDEYISDRHHKILTTPGNNASGISKMLKELVEMA